MTALQDDQDSDVAPISALVDTPSEEERKYEQKLKAEKSAKLASSASESETDKKLKIESMQNDQGYQSSGTEQIDTTTT